MGKFLKKNWFVLLIIVIFAVISTYYIYDTNKGKLKGKTVNGKDVVYSLSDGDVTADDFYDSLKKATGTNADVVLFQKAVANESYRTTKSIKKDAAGNYEISLDVVNTYTNKNTPNGAGNKERLVFNYNGAVEAY